MNFRLVFAGLLAAAVALPAVAAARTKLVTLPGRDAMVVNLENPNYSLLYEEREITLQQGTNHIDFSWQGVNIDMNSIQLEVMDHPGDGPEATKIINVAFPPNEAALTWQLYSPEARTERIRVSYLLHGISRETSYEMTVNPEETQATFQQYFRLGNHSGEDLDDTIIRIIQADDWERSIESGETRRFLSFENRELPIKKLFVARPQAFSPRGEEGEFISLIYEITNDEDSGLGTFKLDNGKARIYSEDPDGSTIFIGEDYLQQTPVGEDAEMKLGTVKDVVLKRWIQSDKRENVTRNSSNNVVKYDRLVHLRYEIENFKDAPSTLRVIETLPHDAVLEELDTDGVTRERKSATELEINIELEPRPEGEEEVPVREINLIYKVPDVLT